MTDDSWSQIDLVVETGLEAWGSPSARGQYEANYRPEVME